MIEDWLEWLGKNSSILEMVKVGSDTWAFDRNKAVKDREICLKAENISLPNVHWCIIRKTDFALFLTLYISYVPLLVRSHSFPSISPQCPLVHNTQNWFCFIPNSLYKLCSVTSKVTFLSIHLFITDRMSKSSKSSK